MNGLTLENVEIYSMLNYTGAIAGYNDNIIEYCGVTGSVIGKKYVGGITGASKCTSCSFSDCNVEGTNSVGGIVGVFVRNAPNAAINCYSTGIISGESDVCGILGGNTGFHNGTKDCYSIAEVNATTKYSYPISGRLEYGSIRGYWSLDTSKLDSNSDGMNRDTKVEYEDLFKKSTYDGFDFSATGYWDIDEGNSTPYLKWAGKRDSTLKINIDKII